MRREKSTWPFARPIDARVRYGEKLVFVDAFGVVEKAADQGGLAIVHAAGSGEAKHLLAEVCGEELLEVIVGSLKARLRVEV